MDVLTDIFQALHFEGNFYFHSEFTAPWGISQLVDSGAIFHAIEKGACWLRLVGDDNRLIRLDEGDFVIIRGSCEHELIDGLTSPVLPLKYFLKHYILDNEAGIVRYGGGGTATRVVCGEFHLALNSADPILLSLPTLIHLKGEQVRANCWLETTLKYIVAETEHNRPGTRVILSHLIDILFIQVLRYWSEFQSGEKKGLLAAIADSEIGVALKHMHNNLERQWTVSSLANLVGMSRAAFAARFTDLMGDSPLKYLTFWRMQMAANWLRTTRLSTIEIAERVGYNSLAAFTRAFKRYIGTTPGAYRREKSG